MSRYDALMARLRAGERILIDGGTGTEVDRRGVPQLDGAWNGGGTLSHPDIVEGVHEDYIRHGAEIVISNTFGTSLHALEDAGEAHRFEEYNRRAVELAVAARTTCAAPGVLVAGSIAIWSWIGRYPALEDLGASVTRQAAIMAAAGADLLMLEMMVRIDRMLVTLEAAQSSGLPVWVGISCAPGAGETMCLYKSGEPLVEALAALKGRGVALINIMHTDVGYIDGCLDVLDEHWDGLVGVYAHTGTEVDTKWVFEGTITPEGYADYAARWLGRGVQVIGGCCGIRPDHIRTLGELV